ncbi:MAG TPA: amidohydrolase family protein [Ilumatobacteraceae bacterium]|nr:amidohydrolase family protein [Ilumatobacteraceae bacterium]
MDPAALPKISADSHVAEPRFLWYDNLPAGMKERGPKGIRPTEEGAWEMVDHREKSPGGERAGERNRLAALEPKARIEVMMSDGISGECIFPTIGLYVWEVSDAAIQDACCQIYNDWIYDQLESKSPRFRCAGLIPTSTPEMAVREIERIGRMGLAAAMMPLVGTPEYNDPSWEPVWDALETNRLPVVMHQGTGHSMLWYRGPGAAVANLLATQSMAPRAVGLLSTSGVLERHPGLHFVFVEVNASWLAWTMDTLDNYYRDFQNYGWVRPILNDPPSVSIARQVHATFQDDPSALFGIERTGIRPLLWGSDYPHEESTYPNSREAVRRQFSNLSEADARAILGGTAAELFRFDPVLLTESLV